MIRHKHLTYEPTTEQVRARWHDRADPIMQFFNECIKEVKGKNTIKSDMYAAYERFCVKVHHTSKSHITFSKRCKANGYRDSTVRKGQQTSRVWLDIEMVDDVDGGSKPAGNIDDFWR